MANGSFGLSGFPTGSSTASSSSSSSTNPFTQKEITVTSVNGFSQGDLVYQYNGDFAAINSSASPGSARFPVPTQKASDAINGGIGGFQYVLSNRNNNNPRTFAKLSNGNIVWVYNKAISTSSHRPYFIVTDENNTVVVAETLIEATALPTKDIGPVVCALSGGGFVVAWVNSSNNLRYGVYTNAGAVTTALQNDTGVTITSSTSNNRLSIAPRPVSGGFVVVVLENTTNIVKHRVYGPTGTATYVWTTNNTLTGGTQIPRVAVRSDDTFVVVSANATTNLFVYYLWSATNTAVSNSSFAATISDPLGTDVITLTDNRYIFIVSTTTGFFFRTLTGSTLSGTSVALIPNTGSGAGYVAATPLSNGGWAVAWKINSSFDTTNLFLSELVFVNVYNSSNTLVSPTYKGNSTTYLGYPYNFIPGSMCNATHFSIIETDGYINVLCDGFSNLASQSMQWSRFSKTNYQIIPWTSNVYNASSTSTNPLTTGNYAPSASSVTSAAFYAANTSTQGWSTSIPTEAQFLAAAQVIETLTSVEYTQAVSLKNGNVVVAWSGYDTNSGVTLYYCKYMIFNSEGNIILRPTILGEASTSATNTAIYMAAMPGGKFAIYYKGIHVLSASGKVLAFAEISANQGNGNATPSLSVLSGDRPVLLYVTTSNELRYSVYDENLNLLSGPNLLSSSAPYGSLVATIGNTLYFVYLNGPSGYPNLVNEYCETSANTWTLTSTGSINQYNTLNTNAYGMANGLVATVGHDTVSSGFLRLLYNAGELRTYNMGTCAAPNANRSPMQIGCTASGNIVVATLSTSFTSFTLRFYWPFHSTVINTVTINHNSNNGAAFTPALASLCGEKMLMAYVSQASGQKMVLNYSIFNSQLKGTDTFTAGSTASGRVTPLTNSNGYTLVGVATSSASPGGTGTVAINGAATLNSNYFFASPGQSFDFSNPITFGAVGSVLERNVTLQGN